MILFNIDEFNLYITGIVDSCIVLSIDKPIFLSIGTYEHAMGLLIKKSEIIITKI